jgi:hypothetical protein
MRFLRSPGWAGGLRTELNKAAHGRASCPVGLVRKYGIIDIALQSAADQPGVRDADVAKLCLPHPLDAQGSDEVMHARLAARAVRDQPVRAQPADDECASAT